MVSRYNDNIPGYRSLPEYLKSIDYNNPTDTTHTNWHHMRGISRFEELDRKPERMVHFQNVMAATAATEIHWTDLFPAGTLIETHRRSAVLLVDVGGGTGHDLERSRRVLNTPAPGALVLQDRGPVIASAIVHENITPMAHNFFEEQPVKGMFLN